MSKWQGDGYTDEQRAALRDLAAKLPPAPCCPDESRLVRDLRGMLDSQGRVSEQHRKRVQELTDEIERYRQRSRDEDTARIRLNHARIEAEADNARLTALLAERDAEIARLREALEGADAALAGSRASARSSVSTAAGSGRTSARWTRHGRPRRTAHGRHGHEHVRPCTHKHCDCGDGLGYTRRVYAVPPGAPSDHSPRAGRIA